MRDSRESAVWPKNMTLLGCAYKLVPELVSAFGKADCMCFDPPYKFDVRGGGKYRNARKGLDRVASMSLHKGFNDEIINSEYAHSAIVFCHNDQLVDLLPQVKRHFHRHCVLSMHKNNPQPVANKHYVPDTEFYIHAWNRGYEPQGKLADKARHITVARPAKVPFVDPATGAKQFHPTVKPMAVMRKIMTNIAGETVLDPFMGTGTTGVAALEAKKRFAGCEIMHEWFAVAQQRLQAVA
ncbi:MAG: site-specific DNA-methyltransferase [Rhizobiaceae bacterium]|nr:site-specific DNA-methyltransferase [Rhizobiaceae bacterium]